MGTIYTIIPGGTGREYWDEKKTRGVHGHNVSLLCMVVCILRCVETWSVLSPSVQSVGIGLHLLVGFLLPCVVFFFRAQRLNLLRCLFSFDWFKV